MHTYDGVVGAVWYSGAVHPCVGRDTGWWAAAWIHLPVYHSISDGTGRMVLPIGCAMHMMRLLWESIPTMHSHYRGVDTVVSERYGTHPVDTLIHASAGGIQHAMTSCGQANLGGVFGGGLALYQPLASSCYSSHTLVLLRLAVVPPRRGYTRG